MTTKLLSSLLFLPVLAFAQTTKIIRGKVTYFGTPVAKVEVLNIASEKMVISDATGNFSIEAKAGDEIGFISKEHEYLVRKIFKDEMANFYTIELQPKPILIDEVEVFQEFTVPGMSYAELGPGPIGSSSVLPPNPYVYNGTTAGINFVGGASLLGKLFPKKEKVKQYQPPVFKEYVQKNFNDYFFTNQLKIAHKDIEMFIDFCNEDPKSVSSSWFGNKLQVTEFLIGKAEEFKKL